MSSLDCMHDKIIVGSGLNAALYSFYHSIPLIFIQKKKPSITEYFQPELDLSKLLIEDVENTMTTPTGTHVMGLQKIELWTKIMFSLNTAGLLIGGERFLSLRIMDDTNEIRGLTLTHGVPNIKFNQLIIFDDQQIRGLPRPKKRCDKYKVVDVITVKASGKHNIDYIKTEDRFVSEIFFKKKLSPRSGNKDILAISNLTNDELVSWDYADTMTRFKVEAAMLQAGIKGPKNGTDPNDPTIQKYGKIKLHSGYRKIIKENMDQYEDTDNITFVDLKDEFVLTHYNPDIYSEQYKVYNIING